MSIGAYLTPLENEQDALWQFLKALDISADRTGPNFVVYFEGLPPRERKVYDALRECPLIDWTNKQSFIDLKQHFPPAQSESL